MLRSIYGSFRDKVDKLPDWLVAFNKRYIGFRLFLGVFFTWAMLEAIFKKDEFLTYVEDSMLISGVITFLLALTYLSSPPATINEVIQRLRDRNVITADERIAEIRSIMAGRTAILSFILGLLAGTAMYFIFHYADAPRDWCFIFTFGGYVVGSYVGAMVADASLGSLLKSKEVVINVMPGHIDSAGGLKPIGEYYFFHAKALAIPAAFFAAWVMIMTVGAQFPNITQYQRWIELHSWMLVSFIFLEFVAFLVPMWSFHQVMTRQKKNLFKRCDRVSYEIVRLKNDLIKDSQNSTDSKDTREEEDLQDNHPPRDDKDIWDHKLMQVELLTERYAALERMPTWPVDPTMSRKFTLGNLILIVPYLVQLMIDMDVVQSLFGS